MRYEFGGTGAVNPTAQYPDGSVNEDEYRRHINWLADNGIHLIQPSAATGQPTQPTREEYRRPRLTPISQ